MTKNNLRKTFLLKRQEIPETTKKCLDFAIEKKILSFSGFISADCLFCFMSTAFEINTQGIIEAAWDAGKTVAVPVVISKSQGMVFRKINDFNNMRTSKFGIREPLTGDILIPDAKTLIVVPAIALSSDFFRVGYGGGFYDKYLSEHIGCNTVGIAYGFQVVQTVPHEWFDMPVGAIITETSVVVRSV